MTLRGFLDGLSRMQSVPLRQPREGIIDIHKDEGGFWWFRGPDGQPFFYRGVCGVNRAGKQGGRFAQDGPYARAIDEKYHYQSDPTAFIDATVARLREWGFNALGAWATPEFFDCGLPYTETLEFAKIPGFNLKPIAGCLLPDIYADRWVEEADHLAREYCWYKRDDPNLIGYFTDNELSWAQPEGLDVDDNPENGPPQRKPSLLQLLTARAGETASGQAARSFVEQRHGSAASAFSAWGVGVNSWGGFSVWDDDQEILTSPAYLEDHFAFTKVFAERYFRVCAESIRRYDKHHLLMGCRFGGEPGKTVASVCKPPYVEILSANNYRHTFAERIRGYYEQVGLPVLIGEFAWASGYFTEQPADNEPSGGLDPEERALVKGRKALLESFREPGHIGYTWYRWVQNPKTGRIGYGLVDYNDDTMTWNTDLLTELNHQADQIRAEAARAVAAP